MDGGVVEDHKEDTDSFSESSDESVYSSDDEVQAPPPPALRQCRHLVHCPGCVFLTPPLVPAGELPKHGCCGQVWCKANPPIGVPDILGDVLLAAPGHGDNQSRRLWSYKKYFHPATAAGWLVNNPLGQPDPRTGQRRKLYSACIHRRIRATCPSGRYIGFEDFEE